MMMPSSDPVNSPSLRQDRQGRGGWLPILIAFAAGLAAMAAAFWFWGPDIARLRSPGAAPSPAVAPEEPELDAGQRAGRVAALESRETELAERIAGLEQRLASVDNDTRLASSFASRAESLLIAFAARRAIDRGLALGYVEGQLRTRFSASEPEAVATVITAAREPVTLEELRAALDTLAPRLLAQGRSEDWWTALRRELGQLIIVRQETAQSTLPADRLARARRLIDAGQVEAALAEVNRMPGAAAGQAWMSAARRFIEARRALNALETAAIQGRVIAPALPANPPLISAPATPTPAEPVPVPTP
ncbi:hypothetical protein NYR55_07770 [Sphingomonas sp. BGYR3]|uniref:hypothetical protein n=1 Tax=Sphingomonas sp. BGYR3 TaxID=2975483 RepID=UPI0021A83665|nr:hypothetical protein [Sphingomonas sp. BGYR3]MDG5488510.1 hypothetical protein [Sphingomonas sp. BGYR3]